MLAHLRYLRYVLRHKFFVYREGRKLGLGRWRLLTHDMSKFSKAEWEPYVEWFYGWDGYGWINAPGGSSRTFLGRSGAKITLYDERERRKRNFEAAWEHHYRNNPHHWEYWLETYDEWSGLLPEPRAREMYPDDRLEMIADWKAMGYANKGYDDSREFYEKTGSSMKLHPNTRHFVERELDAKRMRSAAYAAT